VNLPPPTTKSLIGFLDESGVVAQDRFFAVGVLMIPEGSDLPIEMRKYRQRTNWRSEWHFSAVNTQSLRVHQGLVDILKEHSCWSYQMVLADRGHFDVALHAGDRFRAYERIAAQAIASGIEHSKQAIILADDYSTPDSVRFEEDVRRTVNAYFGTNSLVAVIRIDSTGHDLLQVADVLTGAMTYPSRSGRSARTGRPSPKRRLSAHVRRCLTGRLAVSKFDPVWLDLAANPQGMLPP